MPSVPGTSSVAIRRPRLLLLRNRLTCRPLSFWITWETMPVSETATVRPGSTAVGGGPPTAVEPGRTVAVSDTGIVSQVIQNDKGLHVNLFLNKSNLGLRIATLDVPGTDGIHDYQPTIAMASNGRFVV